MLNTKFTRVASLLMALSLILGLVITGCSDKDREGGQTPSTEVTLKYSFSEYPTVTTTTQQEVKLKVIAKDEEENPITVTPAEFTAEDTAIAGGHIAESLFAKHPAYVYYVFYYNDAGKNIVVKTQAVDADEVEDGDTITEKEALKVTFEVKTQDSEGKDATVFDEQDSIYAVVSYSLNDGDMVNMSDEKSITVEPVDVEGAQIIVADGGYSEAHKALQFKANNEGTDMLAMYIEGFLVCQSKEITVATPVVETKEVYYIHTDASCILDETTGHLKLEGETVTDLETLATDTHWGEPAVPGVEGKKSARVVCYTGNDDDGIPCFTTDGIPGKEAEVQIELDAGSTGSVNHFSCMYNPSNGEVTLAWGTDTVNGEIPLFYVQQDGFINKNFAKVTFDNT